MSDNEVVQMEKKKKKKKKHSHKELIYSVENDKSTKSASKKKQKLKHVDESKLTSKDDDIEVIDMEDPLDCEPSEDWMNDELPRERHPDKIIDDKDLLSEHIIHQVLPRMFYKKQHEEQEILDKYNLTVQRGRLTKVENALLKRSWERYLEDYIVPSPQFMFGNFTKSKENRSVKVYYQTFAIRTKLWLRLAKDLPNRTICQIYQRCRSLLSGLKGGEDFTDKDRELIISLRLAHGDQYSSFCEKYGFNPKDAREVVRNSVKANGTRINHGQWSNEELAKLRDNVRKVMKKEKLDSYDNIPWSVVSADMNRSDVQCRQRFFSKSMFLLAQAKIDIEKWDDKFDMARLIALIKRCNWSEEVLIDWDFLKEQFAM